MLPKTRDFHFSFKKSFTVLKLGDSCWCYLYCSKIDLSVHLFIFQLLFQRCDCLHSVSMFLLPQLCLFLCSFAQLFSQFSRTNAELSLSFSVKNLTGGEFWQLPGTHTHTHTWLPWLYKGIIMLTLWTGGIWDMKLKEGKIDTSASSLYLIYSIKGVY